MIADPKTWLYKKNCIMKYNGINRIVIGEIFHDLMRICLNLLEQGMQLIIARSLILLSSICGLKLLPFLTKKN
jgi:hypothetical protein